MSAYPIPDEALANHIAILGKTGSGKSNGAKTLAERALDRGERVCILDPTGTWYGLRLTRKGKPSPYKVVIFGGQHADLPIGGAHGAAIAETVGTTSTPAVIDTRLMTVADRTRFFTDFAEALLRTNQGPLTLIIDEAHLFAPQSRVNDPRSSAMVHAANNLVSLGRGLGLRIVLISQRPAKLHKDSLTQVETLVAMRLIAPHDREAVREWIKESADLEQGREIMSSLSALPTGDAWVWSPEIGVLHRGHFPLASTFDSGSIQANTDAAPNLAALDLAAVTARLQQVAADVVANDPRALKAEIARLQAEARKAPAPVAAVPTGPTPAQIEEIRRAAFLEGVAEGEKRGNPAGQALMLARVRNAVDALKVDQAPTAAPLSISAPSSEAAKMNKSVATTAPKPPAEGPVGDLTGPQRTVLRSLAWWAAIGKDRPTRNQVAIMCGWSTNSSNIRDRCSELARLGMIDRPEPGRLSLSEAGRAAAPDPGAGGSMHENLRAILTGPQTVVFNALLGAGGRSTRDALAEGCGWSTNSSNIRDRLSELARLDIIERPAPGVVALQAWVNE